MMNMEDILVHVHVHVCVCDMYINDVHGVGVFGGFITSAFTYCQVLS